MSERSSITDSPWYWVLLFSVVGLGAIGAIHVKYGRRQAGIERQYQARERVMEDATADPGRREYSSPEATLIPLWPLTVLLGGAATAAAVMLVRGRLNRGRGRPGSLDEGPS